MLKAVPRLGLRFGRQVTDGSENLQGRAGTPGGRSSEGPPS